MKTGWGGRRRGVQFCDDACRYRYHNAQKKLKREEANAIRAMTYIRKMLNVGGELGEEAAAALARIDR